MRRTVTWDMPAADAVGPFLPQSSSSRALPPLTLAPLRGAWAPPLTPDRPPGLQPPPLRPSYDISSSSNRSGNVVSPAKGRAAAPLDTAPDGAAAPETACALLRNEAAAAEGLSCCGQPSEMEVRPGGGCDNEHTDEIEANESDRFGNGCRVDGSEEAPGHESGDEVADADRCGCTSPIALRGDLGNAHCTPAEGQNGVQEGFSDSDKDGGEIVANDDFYEDNHATENDARCEGANDNDSGVGDPRQEETEEEDDEAASDHPSSDSFSPTGIAFTATFTDDNTDDGVREHRVSDMDAQHEPQHSTRSGARGPPPGPVPRRRLCAFALHNGVLGYAFLDRSHVLVCGQSMTPQQDMHRRPSGRFAGQHTAPGRRAGRRGAPYPIGGTGGSGLCRDDPTCACLRKERRTSATTQQSSDGTLMAPLEEQEQGPTADDTRSVAESCATTNVSGACGEVQGELPPSLHTVNTMDMNADAAVSMLTSMVMESLAATAQLGGEEGAARDADANPDSAAAAPVMVEILFPHGAAENPTVFVSTVVRRALREVRWLCREAAAAATDATADRPAPLPALPVVQVRFTPLADYTAPNAASLLQQLWPHTTPLYWAGRLQTGNAAMMLAIGGALAHISRSQLRVGRLDPPAASHPSSAVLPDEWLIADVVQQPGSGMFVHVDAATCDSLQLFRLEAHPSAVHAIGAAKEGLSVYALLAAQAVSPLGKELLRQWLRLPTCDGPTLEHRLDQVDFFAAAMTGSLSAHDLVPSLSRLLRRVQHPDFVINRLRARRHAATDYRALVVAATSLLDICRVLAPFEKRVAVAQRLIAACQPTAARALIERISTTVDIAAAVADKKAAADANQHKKGHLQPSTARASYTTARILPGVDAQLDELRACYESVDFDTFLAVAAQREAERLPPYYAARLKISVAFMPHLGYLAVLDARQLAGAADNDHREDELGGDYPRNDHPSGGGEVRVPAPPDGCALPEGWALVFRTDDQLFCRTAFTEELDTSIGDLHTAIAEASAAILRRLDEDILQHAHCLTALRHTAEIDACLALARVAVQEGWSRPQLVSDDDGGPASLQIVDGFHPLLPRASQTPVIPFSLFLGRGGDPQSVPQPSACVGGAPIAVLTGAHGSGKSVCQRAVGLLCILAHIGSFVPARGAAVPLQMDHIHAIDHSTASAALAGPAAKSHGPPSNGMSGSLCASSFGQELLAVCRAVHQSTGRSLLLVDEFGKGTLATDGVALLAAVLEDLHDRPPALRPLAIFTTHLTEIFESDLVERRHVAWLHMKVLVQPDGSDNGTGAGPEEQRPADLAHRQQRLPTRPVVWDGTERSIDGTSPSSGSHNSSRALQRVLQLTGSSHGRAGPGYQHAGRRRVESASPSAHHTLGSSVARHAYPPRPSNHYPSPFDRVGPGRETREAAADGWSPHSSLSQSLWSVPPSRSVHNTTQRSKASLWPSEASTGSVSIGGVGRGGVDAVGEAAGGGSRLVFLYELEPCSFEKMMQSALDTAFAAGVPPVVVHRAAALVNAVKRQKQQYA